MKSDVGSECVAWPLAPAGPVGVPKVHGVSLALGPCAGRNQGLAVLRREDDSGAGGLRRARRAMLYGTEARDNTSMG